MTKGNVSITVERRLRFKYHSTALVDPTVSDLRLILAAIDGSGVGIPDDAAVHIPSTHSAAGEAEVSWKRVESR